MKQVIDARAKRTKSNLWRALAQILRGKKYCVNVKASKVYRLANVSRATFRRHYKDVDDILEQKDTEMLTAFDRMKFEGLDLINVWQRVLFFMMRYRDVFLLQFQEGDDRFLRELIEKVYNCVDFGWGNYSSELLGRIFEVYYCEVVGILRLWARDGMPSKDLSRVARQLEYLTETADKRWVGVVK